MKFLVLFSCALAAASAGLIAPITYAGHGIHLPVIDVSGVPVDTAEVQNAKAAHATHYAVAATRAGAYEYAPYVAHDAYAAPLLAHHTPVVAAHIPVISLGHHAYPTTAVLPAVTADGVPLNTPEVAAATADHIAAHHEALSRVAHDRKRRGVVAAAYAAPYAYAAYGVQHLPTIDASGVPIDTAEVQLAKAAHATHHAIAATRAGYEVPIVAPLVAVAPAISHAAPWAHHVPAISHDGTPLDTPEVAHAKAAHFAAYNEAAALNSVHPYVAAYAAPWAAVPADTPEVAQAKADHFAAHAAARANL